MQKYEARQGDLLLQRFDRILRQAEPISGLVLAQDQATGHAHVLGWGQLYRHPGQIYLRGAIPGHVESD